MFSVSDHKTFVRWQSCGTNISCITEWYIFYDFRSLRKRMQPFYYYYYYYLFSSFFYYISARFFFFFYYGQSKGKCSRNDDDDEHIVDVIDKFPWVHHQWYQVLFLTRKISGLSLCVCVFAMCDTTYGWTMLNHIIIESIRLSFARWMTTGAIMVWLTLASTNNNNNNQLVVRLQMHKPSRHVDRNVEKRGRR